MKLRIRHLTALTCAALLGAAAQSQAALITGITLESGSTNPFNTIPMGPAKAINGSGLPGGVTALSGTHSNTFENGWWSLTGPPQITINLNAVYGVDTIHIWNYNEAGSTARSTKNVEIYVSPDGDIANLVKLVTGGTGTHDNGAGDFLLPQGPGLDSYVGFDLSLSGVTNASLLNNVRLIQFKPLDSYGDILAGGVGLAEVQFGAVPEPTTALLGGLGLLALLRRRR